MSVMRSVMTFLALSLLAGRSAAQPIDPDTLRPKAIAFLEGTLEDLRHIASRAQQFTMAFTDETARYPCDVCAECNQLLDPHKYAFHVEEAYAAGFPFSHVIDPEGISERKLDRAEFEWRVPMTKNIPASANAAAKHLSKPFTVHHVATVKYLNGEFSIRTVEAINPPEPHLMLELMGMQGLGTPSFDEHPGFTPEVASTMIGMGASWYFNPFSELNRGNIWLKAGLRISQRTDELTSDELRYERKGVIHTPAYGAQDTVIDAAPTIDVGQRIGGLNETVRSTVLTLPLGISKRITLSASMELSLELEASYAFALSRSISGSYELDQTGTNHGFHYLGVSDIMDPSGGGALTYAAPNAAVRDAATGEDIEFFTGRTSTIEDIDGGPMGQAGFAFLPALLIKKKGAVKHMIGLRLQWVGNPRASDGTLDEDWFLKDKDTARPTLGSMTQDSFRLFAGLTFGTRL